MVRGTRNKQDHCISAREEVKKNEKEDRMGIDHDRLLNFCPNCGEDMREEHEYLIVDSSPYEEEPMDCERASDMRYYNEHYEQTYNPEDGSM